MIAIDSIFENKRTGNYYKVLQSGDRLIRLVAVDQEYFPIFAGGCDLTLPVQRLVSNYRRVT